MMKSLLRDPNLFLDVRVFLDEEMATPPASLVLGRW